ncbi:MAG TPA: EamA family transporter [Allosphingosinicella sp.]|nr:EamA family transporter [Allosphingosinicella sp.]
MAAAAFSIVLFSAMLHALWNAIVKSGRDTLLTTVSIAVTASLIAAAILPFLPPPARASWPFIAASTCVQIVYFVLIARIYRVADMSLVYPLMRGTAPLLVAILSFSILGERLALFAWIGIALVCAGVLGMAAMARRQSGKGLPPALLNAGLIAGYTLIDGQGVRLSGAPAAYAGWLFLLIGAALGLWAAAAKRRLFFAYAAAHWRLAFVGGAGTAASYGLALWAMTIAPIATVAALRETAILFGTAISGLVLKERIGPARVAAAFAIAAGAAALRLA